MAAGRVQTTRPHPFEVALAKKKRERASSSTTELSADDLKALVAEFAS
jgi:hypothetical protein